MDQWLESLVPWGAQAIAWVQAHSSPALDWTSKVLTSLGYEEIYLLLLPLIYWCISREIGIGLGYLSMLSAWLNSAVKYVFAIPRPSGPGIEMKAPRLETSPSFPSGHAQNAVANWGYLAVRFRSVALLLALALLIVAIGLSRIVLGVHFPQDVLGGWLIGLALLAAFAALEPQLSRWIAEQRTPGRLALAVGLPILLMLVHPADTAGLYPAEGAVTPAAALVEGVLVGEQKGLGDDVAADFSVAGLTHILAISGYNITLVINIMALLLKTGGRRLRFYITLLALFVFAAITGFSASVIRASLMGGFVTMALFAGRRADSVNVLLFSALMMVFFNPLIVFYDVSFQLSFLSTLGLILMSPLWKKVARYLPPLIGEDLAVTLSAQIFTTPIILYNFSQLSLVAPVTNIIFLPLIPLIMASGFLAVVLFLLMPLFPVYLIVSTLCWLLCRLLLDGVHLFASLPLASIKIINFDLWWLCFYYAFLLAGLVWIKVKSRPALEQGG